MSEIVRFGIGIELFDQAPYQNFSNSEKPVKEYINQDEEIGTLLTEAMTFMGAAPLNAQPE